MDSTEIGLQWTDNSDNESGFKIEQSTNGTDFTEIATTIPNCTKWTASNLLEGIHYYFRVQAYNNAGNSTYTSTVDAITYAWEGLPTVATAAAAELNAAETSATLSVLGADAAGEQYLTYTWAATMLPAGAMAPTFSVNDTNAAKNTTVTFDVAGTYWFTATITDAKISRRPAALPSPSIRLPKASRSAPHGGA